jgi:hypothetical protein
MSNSLKLRTAKAGVRINVRLPPYIYFRLKEIAEKHNTSLSVVYRTLLQFALEKTLDNDGYEKDQQLW